MSNVANQLNAAAATTSKGKTAYTAEQSEMMMARYTENPSDETVAQLAIITQKSVRSVIAKLSRLGIYKAKEYVSKTGAKPEKKDDTATAIGAVLGLTDEDAASLAKANKRALQAIFAALANSKPLDGGE